MDMRVGAVKVLKQEKFEGGEGNWVERGRGSGEVVESDGRGGGGDGSDVWGGGANVDGWSSSDEDVDGDGV